VFGICAANDERRGDESGENLAPVLAQPGRSAKFSRDAQRSAGTTRGCSLCNGADDDPIRWQQGVIQAVSDARSFALTFHEHFNQAVCLPVGGFDAKAGGFASDNARFVMGNNIDSEHGAQLMQNFADIVCLD
jgi:hypothetical protein